MPAYSVLKKRLIARYAQKDLLLPYVEKSKEGLWKSEEILIKRFFAKKNSKVLDLGCGAGREAIPLAKQGFRVTGIDSCPQMIEQAKKLSTQEKAHALFLEMDAAQLKFRNNSFDYVLFTNNGFEQIPGIKRRLRLLKNMHKVLKPTGRFIFTTHSRFVPGPFFLNYFKWAFDYVLFKVKKILKIKQETAEFGDAVILDRGKLYVHFSNPLEVIKLIKKAGFSSEYFNSKQRIEGKKGPSFFAYFQEPVFYVCKK